MSVNREIREHEGELGELKARHLARSGGSEVGQPGLGVEDLETEKLREETPTTHYEEAVEIPGYSPPPDRCRPMQAVGFCEEGHPVLGRSSCGVRYCPDHWRDWCEDATVAMVARLAAYRHAVEGAEKRMSHVVASPPQDRRFSVRSLWETRSDAYEALDAAGVRGGVCVTHPYRTNDRGDMLYRTARDAGEVAEGTGKWRFLREISDGEWSEMRQYTEAAPHYHALAAGVDVDGEAAPGDWVVKRIRTFKPFYYQDTEAYRDMARTAYYVLTHGAVQQGRQTTTYFSDVHPASFDPEEELTAAVWDRIQMEAEKAVKEVPGEEPDGEGCGHGPEECPREGCEAPVLGLEYLKGWLEDGDNVSALLKRRDGRKRWLRLRGLWLWTDGRTDRPPPGVVTSQEKLLNWLEVQGGVGVESPGQSSVADWGAV